jgi:hypothetical protein
VAGQREAGETHRTVIELENQLLPEVREMVTAERSETKPTKTVKRMYLLQLQVRNLLSRTTDISPDYLEKIGDTGIANQWLKAVKVYGFDATNRCHCGLELEINWRRHTIAVVVWGEEVTIKKTVYTDDLAPEVVNAIEVFNQAVNAELLTPRWRVSYASGVDVERVKQELGLSDAPPITWAGKVFTQSFGITELPELRVRLLIAESDELVPEAQEEGKYPHKEKGLFDRINDAFG